MDSITEQRKLRNKLRKEKRKLAKQQAREANAKLPPPINSPPQAKPKAKANGPRGVNLAKGQQIVIRGQGDYDFGQMGRKAGKKFAKHKEKTWWDHLLDAGSGVAGLASHIAPMLLGMGDYELQDPMPQSNSVVAAATLGKLSDEVPIMHKEGASVRISHREYLGDIYSSTLPYSAIVFSLNPGLEISFPWLSEIGINFTNYRFLGLCFEFISEGSEYSNTAGLGYVAIGTQYDAGKPGFYDKRTLLNSEGAVSCKPSKNMIHCVECKSENLVNDKRYVRSTTAPGDVRLYDLGITTVAVGGNTANNQIIGEIWVTYDVEFFLPKLGAITGGTNFFWQAVTTTGLANATPLGTGHTILSRSTFFPAITSTTQITFPNGARGSFVIEMFWTGASAALVTPTIATSVGAFYASFPATLSLGGGTTTNGLALRRAIDVLSDGTIITIGGAGTIPTVNFEIVIWQFPNSSLGQKEGCIFDALGRNYEKNFQKMMKAISGETHPCEFKEFKNQLIKTDKWVVQYRDKVQNYVATNLWDGKSMELTEDLIKLIQTTTSQEINDMVLDYAYKTKEDTSMILDPGMTAVI